MLAAKGRLALSLSPEIWFDRICAIPGVVLAEMPPSVLIASCSLPGSPPADPADRILAATARAFGYTLVTRDRHLLDYGSEGHIQVMGAEAQPLHRLDTPRLVVRRLVDQRAHRVGGHRFGRVRAELHCLAGEPRVEGVGRQDDRHPVVDAGDEDVGGGRQDGAGLDRVAERELRQRSGQLGAGAHGPALPQPGEGERATRRGLEQPGLPGLPAARPFVEPVGRDQAAPCPPGGAEGGFLGRRLGAGVDRPVADPGVLGPGRDQPPAQHREPARAPVRAHRRHLLPPAPRCSAAASSPPARPAREAPGSR